MAKKKTAGETNLPLIVALVFFVLTTIAFGTLWYMQYSDHQAKEEAMKKAAAERAAAQGAAAEAELVAKVYRVYLGIGDEKDRTDLGAETKGREKIAAELRKINEEISKAAGYAVGAPPPNWVVWNPDSPTEPPSKGLVQAYVDARLKQQVAEKNAAAAIQDFRGAVATLKAVTDELQKQATNYQQQAQVLPKDFAVKLQEAVRNYDNRIKLYQAEEKKSRDELEQYSEQIAKMEREKKAMEQRIARLQEETDLLQDKLNQRKDVFQYDQPLGKILRRLSNNIVEIDLGARDLVRPGLTFVVLPDDFPSKGRQSRMRRVRVPDERGGFRDEIRFIERATIEVIEVVGPTLSRARITYEPEPIRDGAAPGDLLYNAVWRKGAADHIALVGIFDTNGDGRDDIKYLIRDLTNMGIPVDAYYDLAKKQWVGQLTVQTRYVVVGQLPVQLVNDPLRDKKTEMINLITKAVEEARRRGVQDVAYRDFFPRIGYRFNMDVSPDRINQAAGEYIGGVFGDENIPANRD